jgi:hypothetical protein
VPIKFTERIYNNIKNIFKNTRKKNYLMRGGGLLLLLLLLGFRTGTGKPVVFPKWVVRVQVR